MIIAFLNMIIGIVVNVLEEEHARVRKEDAEDAGEASLQELKQQLDEIQALLKASK